MVDPKREALRGAERELFAQEARLAEARMRLADINAKINVGACLAASFTACATHGEAAH